MGIDMQPPDYWFCWLCSRRLVVHLSATVIVDGRPVRVHRECADLATEPQITAAPRGEEKTEDE